MKQQDPLRGGPRAFLRIPLRVDFDDEGRALDALLVDVSTTGARLQVRLLGENVESYRGRYARVVFALVPGLPLLSLKVEVMRATPSVLALRFDGLNNQARIILRRLVALHRN